MKQNESELIARILDGDENAYASLIDRHKEGLYRHCFKFMHDEDEAEDIAHEAFIEAFVHLDRYNPQFRFSTWLYKIATNIALMRLRKQQARPLYDDELDKLISGLPDNETVILYQELHDAVENLPAQYRTIVSMHYWQGKSYMEIAAQMGTSVGSIKGWMSRAKKLLKEVLS